MLLQGPHTTFLLDPHPRKKKEPHFKLWLCMAPKACFLVGVGLEFWLPARPTTKGCLMGGGA